MEIVNKMVPEKIVSGVFLMEETERLKSMMGIRSSKALVVH